MKLNWQAWIYGLGSGFIGGGAGSIGAGFGGIMTDPNDFTPAHPHHLLVLMGWTFLFSGVMTAMAYLKKSPLPDVENPVAPKTN